MKKSQQSKNNEKSLLDKIPLIKFLKRKWDSKKHIKQSLKYFHDERDPKELKSTTPPESEKIEIHCAWVSEVFTPSNINSLLKSLKKLGWDAPESNTGNKINLTDWVKHGRSYGNQSSWINGGIILSKTDKSRFLGADIRRAKLPKGIDYCSLSLRNITSSITIVTIQFVFSDDLASSLNPLFKTLHKTKIERKSRNIISFIGPASQKRKSVQQQFTNVHKNLFSWFNKNLPGHFASSKGDLPTISLVTTAEYKKSNSQKSILKDHYSDLLFDYGNEDWTGKEVPELELRVQSNKNSLGILFGNFGDLTQKDMEQYGGANRAGITNKLNLYMENTAGLWSTHHLLLNCEKQLSSLRDKAVSPIKRIGHAIQNLNFIRSQFLSISTDIQAISHDIENLTKSKNRYSDDCLDFTPPEHYKSLPDFLELLRQQDEMRVKTLKTQEKQVNESINASGNLTSAIANLKIQRNVFWLTIIIVGLTIFSIFKSNPLLDQIFEKVNYLIEIVEKLNK
ncbi:hypothetical protein KJ840_03305 [Patescibacteria group bacterium]|nr:hypothetical protein [Patescibacteria group bacterium]